MQANFNYDETKESTNASENVTNGVASDESIRSTTQTKPKERNKKCLDEEISKLDFYEIKTPDFSSVITSTNIKRLRKRLNLSEKNFADLMGVTTETVDAWESGTVVPRSTTLRLLYLLIKEPKLALCLFELKRKTNIGE